MWMVDPVRFGIATCDSNRNLTINHNLTLEDDSLDGF
jgi:hypothetical protein